MKTWYLMGQVTKRRDLPTHIREAARRLGCLPDLESIRFEKGWSRTRNGQGVYCGIGFADTRPDDHDDPPEPPFDAETLVGALRISLINRNDVSRSILPPEQAEAFTQESLMSGEAVVHVTRAPPPDPEELESAKEHAHTVENNSIEEATERYDKLLVWLSCAVTGTWGQFVEAVRSLGIDDFARPGDVLVRLMLLGHVEIASDGGRWSVNPPLLCGATDGTWFMCGQRDYALMDLLNSHAAAEISMQPHGAGPSRISVSAEKRSDVEALLRDASVALRTVDRTGMRLAESLPDGSQWESSVRGNLRPDLADSLVQRIVMDSEDVESMRPAAGADGSLRVPPGLYVITAEQGRGRSVRTYCHDDGSWTRCDWYGMAYLEQRRVGQLRAFETDGGVVLPPDSPWPRVYERALVLSTGLLPVHVPGRGRLFATLEPCVPAALAAKLGVMVQSLGGSEP
ncbi:MAG: hypothetical protein ACF8R9_12550 [Phycisphaerales bacterium JB054]